jgi:ketosteroid isomerase-like protein
VVSVAALPESVRRAFEVFNDRAWDEVELPEDFVFEAPTDLPGSGTYRGLEGLREFAADLEEGFASLRVEPLEIVAAGPGAVVVKTRIIAKGRHTGLDMDREEFHVLTVDSYEVVHSHRCFPTHAEALRAASVTEA